MPVAFMTDSPHLPGNKLVHLRFTTDWQITTTTRCAKKLTSPRSGQTALDRKLLVDKLPNQVPFRCQSGGVDAVIPATADFDHRSEERDAGDLGGLCGEPDWSVRAAET